MRVSNRVTAFNQSKRSEWFRRILYFISLVFLNWQCFKRNGPCFSCASIELWMHLGSWESTREAKEALGFASCHSNASLVLSQSPACIYNSIDARQAWTIFLNNKQRDAEGFTLAKYNVYIVVLNVGMLKCCINIPNNVHHYYHQQL